MTTPEDAHAGHGARHRGYSGVEAGQLHTAIKRYYQTGINEESAATALIALKQALHETVIQHAPALLERTHDGSNHLFDMLHLPFAGGIRRDPALSLEMAKKGSKAFFVACHHALQQGKLTRASFNDWLTTSRYAGYTPLSAAIQRGDMELYHVIHNELLALRARDAGEGEARYASQLTTANNKGFTALHHAAASGNTALFMEVAARLKALEKETLPDGEGYAGQLRNATAKGFTLLHHAALGGNAELFKAVLLEMEEALPEDMMQQALLARTDETWNLFHTATRLDRQKGTPNADIVMALKTAFFRHFDDETAKHHLSGLLSERNAQGYPPYQERQPEWLRQILDPDAHPKRRTPRR